MSLTRSALSTAANPAISSEDAQRIMRGMLLIRMVEEEIIARYGAVGSEQQMRCPVHLSIGQEAAAVGACYHLTPEDKIFSTHRCHAHYLAKGGDLNKMVLEIYGKIGGCIDGRGGSMHLMDDKAGVAMSVPIVSSSIPLAVGMALANKIDGKKAVSVAFFGDASVEEGVFHESMNFASLMQLPVIFVCENNLFSVYTPLKDRQPARPLAELARAHNMHVVALDGNDPFAVAEAFAGVVERARNHSQPSLIVLDTYRWREHCGVNFDDHLGYRQAEEFAQWKARDPLEIATRAAVDSGALNAADIDAIRTTLAAEIKAAFDAAEQAPLPTPDMAGNHIYAN